MLYSEPNVSSSKLWGIAHDCARKGLSGRSLKKLPLVMHAEWLQREGYDANEAIQALQKCLMNEGTSLAFEFSH